MNATVSAPHPSPPPASTPPASPPPASLLPASPLSDCHLVEWPEGIAVLRPDGSSVLVSGATCEQVATLGLPDPIVRALAGTAARPRRPRSGDLVVVVGSAPGRVLDEVMVEGGSRPRRVLALDNGAWRGVGRDRRRRPGLVVVVPEDPMGGREVVDHCRAHEVPCAVAWAGAAMAWVGPVGSDGGGCQRCLDLALTDRDPRWVHTATRMGRGRPTTTTMRWLWQRVGHLDGAAAPARWWVRTSSLERVLPVPVHPDCRSCQVVEDPWSSSSRWAA